jgi:putative Mg2+ transporter-C (MgtC) family protein
MLRYPTLEPIEALIRLGLALVLGALVGLERERGERSAGLRTHALVCLGSALFMLVSAYGMFDVVKGTSPRPDPGRIAAQVVSGIGFLGAGTIIFRREVVRVLTTAAGLWVVSAIGLAAGAGMYVYAVGGTAGTLIILAVLKPVEARLFPHTRRLALRVRPDEWQLSAVRAAFQQSGIRVLRVTLQWDSAGGQEIVTLEYVTPAPANVERLIETLRGTPGFVGIESAVIPQAGSRTENDDQSPSAE